MLAMARRGNLLVLSDSSKNVFRKGLFGFQGAIPGTSEKPLTNPLFEAVFTGCFEELFKYFF